MADTPKIDARIQRGMERQLRARDEALRAGAKRIGWKVAINDPKLQARVGIDRVAVGYMTTKTLLASGARFSLKGTTRVGAEPEIGIEMGRDLAASAGRDEAVAAVESVAAAIEIVDADRPVDDLEELIATNIFHRGVIFAGDGGNGGRAGADISGVVARCYRNGVEESHADAASMIGDLAGLILTVAGRLEDAGDRLLAGDRIISGALTAPLWVKAGERVTVEMGVLGKIEVAFVE